MPARRPPTLALFTLVAVLGVACSSSNQTRPADAPCAAWMDTSLDPDARAQALVSAMTLEQKIDQTHGHATPEDFRVVLGIEELCIPDLTVTNGPAGVGPGPEILNNVPATAFPSTGARSRPTEKTHGSCHGSASQTSKQFSPTRSSRWSSATR